MPNKQFMPMLMKLVCMAVLLSPCPVANAQLDADDDDFIILDDRGDGAESGEEDVHLSGRKPRPSTSSLPPAIDKRDGEVNQSNSNSDESVPQVAPPKRFEPTERVSEDLSVSFPVDI